jgi:hypothetical protein
MSAMNGITIKIFYEKSLQNHAIGTEQKGEILLGRGLTGLRFEV